MSAAPLISIVDDDDSLRNSLNNLIRSVGFRAQGFPSAEAFLNSSELHDTACLILDVRMPGMSGLDLQRQLRGDQLANPDRLHYVTRRRRRASAGTRGRRGGLFV